MQQSSSVSEHPFLSHLVALLSICDLEPNPKASPDSSAILLPRYEGPRDLQTDAIERSLARIVHRLRLAEEKLGAVHPWTPRRDFGYNPESDDDDYLNPPSSQDLIADPVDVAPKVSQPKDFGSPRAPRPMRVSLEGLQHISRLGHGTAPDGSALIVPPAALSVAAVESGMSAVEELRLLKAQVSDVARVCKAVTDGDLTQKITVPVQGPLMVQLKDVVNTMVDKLAQFAKEVARVSLEFGTEGYAIRPARTPDANLTIPGHLGDRPSLKMCREHGWNSRMSSIHSQRISQTKCARSLLWPQPSPEET